MNKYTKISLILIISLLSIYLVTNVSKKLTAIDVELIESLDLDKHCLNINNFKKELNCIKKVQTTVFNAVPHRSNYDHLKCSYDTTPIDERHLGDNLEPYIYINNGFGCCNVKSRFIEKILIYYNFNVRHLAVYRVVNFLDFFSTNKNTISHSSTEVKTSKGWMYVDSVDDFVGITKSFEPITSLEYFEIDKEHLLYKFLPSKENAELYQGMVNDYNYWNKNHNVWNNKDFKILVIYGLHSRHGNFYKPKFKLPIPDISWLDFFYNYEHLTK